MRPGPSSRSPSFRRGPARAPRLVMRLLLGGLVGLMALSGMATGAAATGLRVAEGLWVRVPAITIVTSAPEGTAVVEVGDGPTPTEWRAFAPDAPIPWTLPVGPDGPRVITARFLAADGSLVAAPERLEVVYDTTPPPAPGLDARAIEAMLVCRPEGPRVAGASARRTPYRVTARIPESGARLVVAAAPGATSSALPPGGRLDGRPGRTLAAQAVDRAGNAGEWTTVRLPRPPRRVLRPDVLPFTAALACPIPPPLAGARSRAAAGVGHRERVRVAGSALVWTVYGGQGAVLNWVHAATHLNEDLRLGRHARYRAGVAEMIAASTVGRGLRGRPFRINENRCGSG